MRALRGDDDPAAWRAGRRDQAAFAFLALLLLAPLLAGCALLRPAPARVPADRPLRVMTWRAGWFLGGDGRIDVERVAAVVRTWHPDVLLVQEIDRRTLRALARDQVAELGAELGLPFHWLALESLEGGASGVATFTALPVRGVVERSHEMPSQPGRRAGALGLRVAWGDADVVLWNIAVPDTDIALQYAHLRWLAALAEANLAEGEAPLLAGTFGADPGTTPFEALRLLLTDVWSVLGTGRGYTAPSVRARRRLDYVLIPTDGPVEARAAWVINAQGLAAHLPLVADLALRPAAPAPETTAPILPDGEAPVMEPEVPLAARGGQIAPGERLPDAPEPEPGLPGVNEPFAPRGRPSRP